MAGTRLIIVQWLAAAVLLAAGAGLAQAAEPTPPPPVPAADEGAAGRAARYAAWRAANTDIEARLAGIVARTGALVAADQQVPAAAGEPALRTELRKRSAALTPAQRAAAAAQVAQAFNVWQGGNLAGAATQFDAALAIDPVNAQANFYKAYLAQRAGDAATGRLFYGRAAAFGGASDERLRAAAIVRRLGPPQSASADDPGADLPPVVWRADTQPTVLWECIDCPQMTVIPAGAYTMGSPAGEAGRVADEGPRLRIILEHPLAVGRFEVSFAEWDACVAGGGCNGYRPSDEGWGRGQRPVVNVSWDDAQAYVDWLSRKTGEPYRLLTEAEWEYAARGGRATPYWTGAGIDPTQANIAGKIGQTRPVGAYAPNPFGLYDTAGNVWEWASDCAIPKAADTAGDANAPTQDCSVRVVRGGGWGTAAPLVRSAYPDWATPMTRGNMLGFRVARDLD